jgi:hypothetical protein
MLPYFKDEMRQVIANETVDLDNHDGSFELLHLFVVDERLALLESIDLLEYLLGCSRSKRDLS